MNTETDAILLKVDDVIEERFRSLFPFQTFNCMQSQAVPVILESDRHCVVAAPTASGKTIIAIAAMVRELSKPSHGKILYIAPMRALTNEKESEWAGTFSLNGLFSIWASYDFDFDSFSSS